MRTKDIVGIFDLENTSISKHTKDYLAAAEKLGRVVYTTYELPKSFVVCFNSDLEEKVYISQLACSTLKKRYLGSLQFKHKGNEYLRSVE